MPDANAPWKTHRPRHGASSLFDLVRLLHLSLLAVAFVATADLPTGTATADDAAPLVLSNQHVGMTSVEVEAAQPQTSAPHAQSTSSTASTVNAPDPDAGASDSPNDLEARARSLEAVADEAKRRADAAADRADRLLRAVEAVEAGRVPGVGPNKDGPATFDRCMEATIRAGDSLAAADRLCRAVYSDAHDMAW